MNALLQPLAQPEDRHAPWPNGEQRLLLHNMSWEAYEMIGEALRDRTGIFLTYDRGNLEIMTTSPEHERYDKWLGRLVEVLAEEFSLQILPLGRMTFKSRSDERGLEPDDCYWIANERHMRARLTWDPTTDPPPDLFIEIETSRCFLDRMAICAALSVREVWRFNGETLRVFLLQSDRTYQESAGSPTFPGIPIAGIVPFILPSETRSYLETIRAFRAWVQEQKAKKS